ncbi:C4-dicarboxylic acid transporter DauA [Pontiella desulfatans]|uniref:C4-dicarboxylic acid transporter DauA n=1 Tax=Pontiella desulfatans TaxID=2750659 RepID=A0A6C2UB00_PONDE|nr:sulfate permease [Pontiella desulfatans]VGO17308.1 C4-dicarboxylic acid transporter DauA [Pontiella desulfatans]
MFRPKLFTLLKTYNRSTLTADAVAGLTVGIIALPLAMAFAIASGLPPERGLFTAIVAGFLISLLGGSRVQIGGPTGAFVVIVSGIVAEFGYDGLVWCMLMAGGLLILFGLCRLGGLIRFIPFPVTTGFTSGIAVVIFSTQIKDLLGLEMATVPAEFLPKWAAYFQSSGTVSPATAALGIGSILLISVLRRWNPRTPAMLVSMLATTAAAALLHLDVETIGSRFGDLPRMLPAPGLPAVGVSELGRLIPAAFTVALLAAIESLLSATVADGMIGGKHRPNTELIAQGIANIGSAFFGGIPATGAIARTAANVKSGARSPVAGIIHAIVLALVLLLFAPLAKRVPLATLAGILVVVAWNMGERHHFMAILKGPRSDRLVLVLTFVLTVLVDLTVAVQVGIVLSALLFIRRMAENANVSVITDAVCGDVDAAEDPKAFALREVPPGVEVYEIEGPFFFGMADTFWNALGNRRSNIPVLILRIRNVPAIDATGLHNLRELHRKCLKDGTRLVFSGVALQPKAAFTRSGFLDEVGAENFCPTIDDALERARRITQE